VAADDIVDGHFFARETEPDRAGIIVNAIGRAQALEVTLVNRFALTLKIRTEISSRLRAFVPIEAEPAQPVVNGLRGFGGVARAIGVFNAKDKSAAGVFRVKPVEQGRPRATDMEVTGGRRSETDANGRRHRGNGVMEYWSVVDLFMRQIFYPLLQYSITPTPHCPPTR
jgi:hypothetical protein